MFSSRSDRPAVPGFHPEFGLLCPRRRRAMRLAMLSVVTTMAIGATMGLAVARWPDRDGLASMVQPMDELPSADASAPGVDATRMHESCKADTAKDLAAFFFKTVCGANKSHVRHGGRPANRVATVIIGRTDMAPSIAAPPIAAPAPAPVEATASEPPQPDVAIAEKAANSTTPALERAAAPKRAKAKASAAIALAPPGRDLSRQNVTPGAPMLNAYVPNARYESPYGSTFRSSSLQSGFDAPFARSRSQWP